MPRPAVIPVGSWPRRMPAELAAGYCGETTVEAFIARVGTEYPHPRVSEGGAGYGSGTLDQSILPPELRHIRDVAEDLCLIPHRLPRFVIAKLLASGAIAFYWNPHKRYRRHDPAEPLDTDVTACGEIWQRRPCWALNGLFEEWRKKRNGEPVEGIAKFGTVDWLFREFKSSVAYQERVSARTRPDYERTMARSTDFITKKGDRVGDRKIKAITPVSADKLYTLIAEGRLRQGEKLIVLCRRAWRVVHRLHPDQFNADVPNPWDGVTKKRRVMATKPAATREQVYAFAKAAIEAGRPEAGGAAVICFEWLQRPENVLAGYVRWSDYRSPSAPNAIRIEHHKTGAKVLHPLVDPEDGAPLYPDAEAVLAAVPRLGIPLILKRKADGATEPYTAMQMAKIVRKVRDVAGLPSTFTLDACRHGGMTELEEAGLTDGQGRALSAHRSKAYEGYAKRTFDRALAATRKRRAHACGRPGERCRNRVSEWPAVWMSECRWWRRYRYCLSACSPLEIKY